MTTIQQELENFTVFARQQIAKDETGWSIDELFNEWRLKHPPADGAKAVQASLRDMENGNTGREFGEFADEFRKLNGITE